MNMPLPHGWTSASVAKLALRIQYGTSAKTNRTADGIPVIRMGNIQDGKIVLDDVKTLPHGHKEFPELLLEAGDVLFNRTNSPELVGKTAVFSGGNPTSFASYLIRIRLGESCLPKWLSWYINSRAGRDWIASVVNQQVGQANVSGGKLRELELPLPPIVEQRRIIAKLEALLAKVDTSRHRLDQVPNLLRRFRKSILVAACEGRLTEDWRAEHPAAPAWSSVRLGNLASVVTSGSRGWAAFYADQGALFIRTQNINTDKLVLGDVAHVRAPAGSDAARTRVQRGDLLVTITGANVTKTALVCEKIPEAYVNQHIGLIRLKSPESAPFIHLVLTSPTAGRRQLEESAYGAGKPGLNLQNIKDVSILLPGKEEQAEIVRRSESLFTLLRQIEARYTKAKTQVDRLTQSILAKAFRGELVPQDPNDEPAEALLARLGTSPAGAVPSKRRGRPRKADG